MKRAVMMFAGLSSFALASPAAAQTRPGFEIGAELFDYAYRERVEGEVVAQDDGTFGGVTLGYVETIGGGSFLRARFSADFGSTDYRSPLLGIIGGDDNPSGPVRLKDVSQDIGQLELQFGHDFAFGRGVTLAPFTGIGARVLNDYSGKKAEFGGYDRQISYSYIPVGLAVRTPMGGRTSLLLSAQYNQVLRGHARSYFSKIDPEFPDIKLDLKRGHGLEASAVLQRSLGRRAISVGPFIRHWNISRSKSFVLTDPEGSGEAIEFYEPKNRTTEIGVRLGFSF